MTAKAVFAKGHWVVRINWRKRRAEHRVHPDTQERAMAVAEIANEALKTYGEQAFEMLFEKQETGKPKQEELLKDFGDRWLVELDKTDKKTSTKAMYESNWRVHIRPALGEFTVPEIDYPMLKAFILAKRDATYSTGRFRGDSKKRHKKYIKLEHKKYSKDTVRVIAMTLRALFKEAVKEKIVMENPVQDLSQFYRKRRKEKVVTRNQVYTLEELHRIEDHLAANRTIYGDDYEMSLAMSRTGMRIGETRALVPDDFDWLARTIRIERNIPSGIGIEEDSAKTHAGERMIDMPKELADALQAMLARRTVAGFKAGKRSRGAMFPIRYEAFHEDWRRAQKQLGIRYRSPHSIRHTWASIQISSGADILWVSHQLGHSSPNVTLEIYAHFVPGKKPKSIDIMDRNANKMRTLVQED
jgi:integrase